KKWYVGRRVCRLRRAFLQRAAIGTSCKEREPDGVLQAKDDQRPEPGYRHGHGAPATFDLSENKARWAVVRGRGSTRCEHDSAAHICTHCGSLVRAFPLDGDRYVENPAFDFVFWPGDSDW